MIKQWTILLSFILIALPAVAQPSELNLITLKKQLTNPDYEVRKAAVKEFYAVGSKRQLKKEEIEVLLSPFKSDDDWRIKVRISLVFPFAADKAQVLPSLISALRIRDDEASGGGNLQIYSCTALAEIGNSKALPAMREWLSFLNSNPEQFKENRDTLIKKTEKCIKELENKELDANKRDTRQDKK